MKNICPLCNGLYEVFYNCTKCNTPMLDKGAKVNYLDNYSPYLLDEVTHLVDGVARDECVHVYYCPNCGYKNEYSIERKKY